MEQEIDKQKVSEVFKILKQNNGLATVADIVVPTGFSNYEVEDVLEVLIEDYPCHFEVSEHGQVIYCFDIKTKRKETVSLQDLLFKVIVIPCALLFRLWILVMMFTYMLIMAPISFLFFITGGYFILIAFSYLIGGELLRQGLSKTEKRPCKKTVFQVIWSFVAGDPPLSDALANEKKLLNYIIHYGQMLTIADVVKITGWSYKQAEDRIALIMSKYHGKVRVDEDGVLIFDFEELNLFNNDEKKIDKPFIWDNPPVDKTVGSNYKSENSFILSTNSLLMLVSGFIILMPDTAFPYLHNIPDYRFWIGIFPFTYSVIFYCIALFQRLWFLLLAYYDKKAFAFKKHLKYVFASLNHFPFENNELFNHSHLKSNFADAVKTYLNGELETNENAELVYRFPILFQDVKNSASVRVTKQINKMLQKYETELDLSNLGLTSIPETVFNYPQIKKLDVSGNFLSEIPEIISQLKELEILVANDNILEYLPESLPALNQLKELHLSENRFSHIPEAVCNCSNLILLKMSNNRIMSVSPSVSKMNELICLHVENNSIIDIGEELTHLPHLELLYAEYNPIEKVAGTRSPKLRKMILEKHRLTEDEFKRVDYGNNTDWNKRTKYDKPNPITYNDMFDQLSNSKTGNAFWNTASTIGAILGILLPIAFFAILIYAVFIKD